MLQKLHIQNYAIIDDLTINFENHLNVITGETGAGKSILMGALSLILGDRADSSVLLQKEKKCVVEGWFDANNKKGIKQFLATNDLDAEEVLLVRREIAVNGKSRAFINDTPVTVTQLKTLNELLVDLHQQFDTLELGDSSFQREVLDALAALACKETKKKGSFVLPGFGKLVKVQRAARTGRNPATGAAIQIKAKTVVKFRIAKACKDAIL